MTITTILITPEGIAKGRFKGEEIEFENQPEILSKWKRIIYGPIAGLYAVDPLEAEVVKSCDCEDENGKIHCPDDEDEICMERKFLRIVEKAPKLINVDRVNKQLIDKPDYMNWREYWKERTMEHEQTIMGLEGLVGALRGQIDKRNELLKRADNQISYLKAYGPNGVTVELQEEIEVILKS